MINHNSAFNVEKLSVSNLTGRFSNSAYCVFAASQSSLQDAAAKVTNNAPSHGGNSTPNGLMITHTKFLTQSHNHFDFSPEAYIIMLRGFLEHSVPDFVAATYSYDGDRLIVELLYMPLYHKNSGKWIVSVNQAMNNASPELFSLNLTEKFEDFKKIGAHEREIGQLRLEALAMQEKYQKQIVEIMQLEKMNTKLFEQFSKIFLKLFI